MGRRRFDHLIAELSVALGRLVPRYALWLRMHELGWDPERLAATQATAFVDGHLDAFLAQSGDSLTARAQKRLSRSVERFDPLQPTPYETMERLGGA